jgi:hypothetical protein
VRVTPPDAPKPMACPNMTADFLGSHAKPTIEHSAHSTNDVTFHFGRYTPPSETVPLVVSTTIARSSAPGSSKPDQYVSRIWGVISKAQSGLRPPSRLPRMRSQMVSLSGAFKYSRTHLPPRLSMRAFASSRSSLFQNARSKTTSFALGWRGSVAVVVVVLVVLVVDSDEGRRKAAKRFLHSSHASSRYLSYSPFSFP